MYSILFSSITHTYIDIDIIIIPTSKYWFYPSTKRCLFTTDRGHYRKPQWIKILRTREDVLPA